jgi:AcrR family transcriptional regulator
MSKRFNPAKQKREKQIKDAALKLFAERGYYNTTISQIAEGAGLSKGTIYWYWKTKDELAFSLIEEMLSDFLRLIEKARDGEGGFLEKSIRLGQEVADLYEEEKEQCRLLWRFRADRHYIFDTRYSQKVASYYERMRSALAELVQQGIDKGEIYEVDPVFLAFIILGITEGLEIEWLESEGEFDLRSGLPAAFSAFYMGILKRTLDAGGSAGL